MNNLYDAIVDSMLTESGFQKTASTRAYTSGILTEAMNAGIPFQKAAELCVAGLTQSKEAMEKAAFDNMITNSPEMSNYAVGFMKAALANGYSPEEAMELTRSTIHNVLSKQANDGAGASGQFGPDSSPSPDQMPTDAGAGQLSPEVLQQLAAELSQQTGQQITPEMIMQLLASIDNGAQDPQSAGAQPQQ